MTIKFSQSQLQKASKQWYFSWICIQLQVGQDLSMENDQQTTRPIAPSNDNPEIDLLREPLKHRCEFCLTPLQRFTKIIATRTDSETTVPNQGYHVVCVSCFAGWSREAVPMQEIEQCVYKYFVCRGMGRPLRQLGGWSGNELIQLQGCIEMYGPQITNQLRQSFIKASGTQKSIAILLAKFRQINSVFSKGTNTNLAIKRMRRHWKPEQTIKPNQYSAKNIIDHLRLNSQEQQKQAKQFLKLINYRHPLDFTRKYPDNQADYIAKSTATNKLTQERVGSEMKKESPVKDAGLQDTLRLISCFLRQKAEKEREIIQYIQSMTLRYATFKRGNRKIGGNQKEKIFQKLQQLTHPELAHLLTIKGAENQLRKIIRFNHQREQIFEDIKQKKKSKINRQEPEQLPSMDNLQSDSHQENEKQQHLLNILQQQCLDQGVSNNLRSQDQ